jgi:hypothetical protein
MWNKFRLLAPVGILLVFVALKFQDLFLPYFWDEAWSYVPAVLEMAQKGSSLLPNAIDPELYRGHPLMFYFLASAWVQAFGASIPAVKAFPLLVSLVFLWRYFTFSRAQFGTKTAQFALVLLPLQSVFFAQSAMLLPEILLALFTLLALDTYLRRKLAQTTLWLTLALYTKESAAVIWGTLFLLELVRAAQSTSPRTALPNLLIFLFPLAAVVAFFVAQRVIVGWYLFPDHVSFIRVDAVLNRLTGYLNYLLWSSGRNVLTILTTTALVVLGIRKKRAIQSPATGPAAAIGLFALFYLMFSSLNFYSPRYLLSVLPLLLLLAVHLWVRATEHIPHWLSPVLALGLVAHSTLTLYTSRASHDHTVGFRDAIHVHRQMVAYCEDRGLMQKPIATHFLMKYNLTRPELGYLRVDAPFSHIDTYANPNARYAIFSSMELDSEAYRRAKQTGTLLQAFRRHTSWCELYELKPSPQELREPTVSPASSK